jgi:chemotaxis protein CheY-P-specific phosphatase CheC
MRTVPPPSERALVEAGAHAAARALGLLLRAQVHVVDVGAASVSAIAARYAPRACAVTFTVTSALPGRFVVLTTEASAQGIAAELVGATAREPLGALKELGNITASAFLNGVAALLETSCVPSVPSIEMEAAERALAHALGRDGEALYARLARGTEHIDLVLGL